LDLDGAPFRGVIAGDATGDLLSLLALGLRGTADGSEELDGVAPTAAFLEGVTALLLLTDDGLAGAACLVNNPALRQGRVLLGELFRVSWRRGALELVALLPLSVGSAPAASLGPSATSVGCWPDPGADMLELETAVPIALQCIAFVRSAGGDTQTRR